MKEFEVKEVLGKPSDQGRAIEVKEVIDNSLASEHFADVAAARGIVSNFSNFLNS